MLFWVDRPFTYTSKSGIARICDPGDANFLPDKPALPRVVARGRAGPGNLLDATDTYWDIPPGWLPPIDGSVRPIDGEAVAKMQAAVAASPKPVSGQGGTIPGLPQGYPDDV